MATGTILVNARITRRVLCGAEPLSASPVGFAAFVVSETVRWAEVVRRSGARFD